MGFRGTLLSGILVTRSASARSAAVPDLPGSVAAGGLLDTRFAALASNTIDYWMLPDDPSMTEDRLLRAIQEAPVQEDASLQIYLHVPFCAQRCRFCAFSGGNSLEFREAGRFARLVVEQMTDLLERTRIRGRRIASVNVGGGSPDLLGSHVGTVLRSVRELPGCADDTEISVELTLSTTQREFIEELVRYDVTKVSFGIQSLNPQVRRHMRQPVSLRHLDQVLDWIDGRIPIVNADLITGLPGQDLAVVNADLRALMQDERIQGVSSYLLTAGAAPSMLAAMESGVIPTQPGQQEQALMRLHTYGSFLRQGWVRRGTNSYYHPGRIPEDVLTRVAGNECIGTSHYGAFLLAAGPQAVSCLPGARIENRVDIEGWCRDLEHGNHPFHLPKCSDAHQKDTALWVFPLRWEGLPRGRFESMLEQGALTVAQIRTLEELVREGLLVQNAEGFELTLLGEVFMGQLVRSLKKPEGRRAIDEYVEEGHALGLAIAGGRARDANETNNRQIYDTLLGEGRQPDG